MNSEHVRQDVVEEPLYALLDGLASFLNLAPATGIPVSKYKLAFIREIQVSKSDKFGITRITDRGVTPRFGIQVLQLKRDNG